MTPYPLRVLPGQFESLRGLMHRLSIRNGFEKVAWLMRDIGCRKITSPLSATSISKFAGVSGIPVLDLERRQEEKFDRVTRLNGHNIPLGAVDRLNSRYCADCFEEDGQHQWIWDYLPLTHCPKHSRPLLSKCPTCQEPLRWLRPALNKCPKGHSLVVSRRKVTSVDQSSAPVSRAIVALMTRADPADGNRSSLHELVIAAEILGCIGRDTEPSGRINSLERYADPLYPGIVARGYEILEDLPIRLPEVLDQLSQPTISPLSPGSSFWRDQLHNRLVHFSEYPTANRIARVLWQFAEHRKISLYPGAFGWAPPSFKSKYIAATAARDILKTDFKRMKKIAREENWVGAEQISTGTPSWLVRSEVTSWIKRNEKLVTATGAGSLLGITRETLHELNASGVFGTVAKERKNLSALMPRFKRAELDGLLIALKACATNPIEPKDAITWMAFTKRPESKALTFAQVVSHILAGRIRAYSPVSPELPKLTFSCSDTVAVSVSMSLGGDLSGDQLVAAGRTLSLREASLKYKLGYYRMRQAVERGLVPLSQAGFGITKGYVSDEAMRSFLQKYTTSRLVAETIGRTTISTTMALRKLGVPAVGRSGIRDSANGIFAWDDVRKAGLPKIKAMATPLASAR
jgi:hypothetical protein